MEVVVLSVTKGNESGNNVNEGYMHVLAWCLRRSESIVEGDIRMAEAFLPKYRCW